MMLLPALLCAGCASQRTASSPPRPAPRRPAIAWGEPVGGLQVGLEIVGSDAEMRLRRIADLTGVLARYTGPEHRMTVSRALAAGAGDRRLGYISGSLSTFGREVQGGRRLSEVLGRYWQPVNRELVEEVRAAEARGDLPGALERLAGYFHKKARPRGHLLHGERICGFLHLRNVGETAIRLRSHRGFPLDLCFTVNGGRALVTYTPDNLSNPPIRPRVLQSGGGLTLPHWWIQRWLVLEGREDHARGDTLPPGRYSIVAACTNTDPGGRDGGYWRGRAASAPVTLEIRPDPSAPVISWGPRVNGLRAALVPRGASTANVWKDPSICPACAADTSKDARGVCTGCGGYSSSVCHWFCEKCALERRVCRGCKARRAPGARFAHGRPLEFELQIKNLAEKDITLFDAAYPSTWRLRCVPEGGGKVLIGHHDPAYKENRINIDVRLPKQKTTAQVLTIGSRFVFGATGRGSAFMKDAGVFQSLPPGRYTVTASYTGPVGFREEERRKYWQGTLTTGPARIEVLPPRRPSSWDPVNVEEFAWGDARIRLRMTRAEVLAEIGVSDVREWGNRFGIRPPTPEMRKSEKWSLRYGGGCGAWPGDFVLHITFTDGKVSDIVSVRLPTA